MFGYHYFQKIQQTNLTITAKKIIKIKFSLKLYYSKTEYLLILVSLQAIWEKSSLGVIMCYL